MTVAIAAPAIPISSANMNIGSSIMLRTDVNSIIFMEIAALPIALSELLRQYPGIPIIAPIIIISMYIFA